MYYAVKHGKIPGIYETWADCSAQVTGFKGAVYRSFKSLEEAQVFVSGDVNIKTDKETSALERSYAFVDGSFNIKTNITGYGGFIVNEKGEKYILQGNTADEEWVALRNVAGELLGAIAAMKKAISLGMNTLTIYYDYQGIESWANGNWKTKNDVTKAYKAFFDDISNTLAITFVKVKGHTNIDGNEIVDRLAKQAVGVTVK